MYDSLEFKMIESSNDGRKESLRQWGQADRREDRPSMFYPITINGIEVYPIKTDGTEGRWRVGKEKAHELLEKGLLELTENNGISNIIRTFEASTSSVPYGSLLLDEVGTTAKGSVILKSLNMSNAFDYSKPITLISFFEMLCTNENDIILDFFSGSATTAHSTMQLNSDDGGTRRFIMIQLDELTDEKSEAYRAGYKNICEIGKERIRRAGDKIKEEILNEQPKLGEEPKNVPDIGFRVFKVADTNMKDVYYNPSEYNIDLDKVKETWI